MESRPTPVPTTADSPETDRPRLLRSTERALARSGFWSGAGFASASALAGGLLLLTRGDQHLSTVLIAVALIVAGGVAATYSWRRAWANLDQLDAI